MMKTGKIAALVALAVSFASTSVSAAEMVRASSSRVAVAPRGVAAGQLLSSTRASKKVSEDNSLLGAPLFLLILGGVAVTIGTIAVVDNGGSN
jgi:hypothetical protein